MLGCFLACFGRAKDRKQRRRIKKQLPVNQSYNPLQTSPSPQKPIIEAAAVADVVPVPELIQKHEDASFSSSCSKKVTFDPNVKAYEDAVAVVSDDVEDSLEVEKALETEGKISSSSNYRYTNCESSDDEGIDDDDDAEESVDEDEEEEDELDVAGNEEESYESFFSLPIGRRKEQDDGDEVNSPMPVSVSTKGGARDRSQYVHSVLNPIENLSQWKEVKKGAMPLKNLNNVSIETKVKNNDKENDQFAFETKLTRFSPEPTFKANKPRKHIDLMPDKNKEEIAVDTSLSTWLVQSDKSQREDAPHGSNSRWSNSSVSREDQPILGALTVDDLRQSSVTSSPTKSPNRNPDEMPILGSVGSYWNTTEQNSESKGIPNTTSKYREDMRVKWHSTPFEEERLERALRARQFSVQSELPVFH